MIGRPLLLTGCVVATCVVPVAAVPGHDSAIHGFVVDTLQVRVKTLSRSVRTYHCAPRARIGLPRRGYLPPDQPGVVPYLREKLQRYWDLEIPTRPHGFVSGLFLGIDPVVCRHFGGVGEEWALIQVTLDEGLRFIDVRTAGARHPRRFAFPAEVQRRLSSSGCPVTYPATLLTSLEFAPCRQIATRALSSLGVAAILDDFPRVPFKECPDRTEGVFIALDPDVLENSRVMLFTADIDGPDSASADRLMIRELFGRARAVGSRRAPPWASLRSSLPPREVDAWMRRHLFGCGDAPEEEL